VHTIAQIIYRVRDVGWNESYDADRRGQSAKYSARFRALVLTRNYLYASDTRAFHRRRRWHV